MESNPAGRAASGATLLIGASLFLPAAPALAANECGPPPPGGGTVVCPAGQYPNGIEYDVVADLTVVLQPGVAAGDSLEVSGSGPGVDVRVQGPVDTNVSTTGGGAHGILAEATVGDVTILSDTVGTSGDGADGIVAALRGQLVRPGPFPGSGEFLVGPGDISIDSGPITTLGFDAEGIVVSGSDAISIASEAISTQGHISAGIYVHGFFYGAVTVVSGTIATAGNSEIPSSGQVVRGAHGMELHSRLGAVDVESGAIETRGAGAYGMLVTTLRSPIDIVSEAVTTAGDRAIGIFAETGVASARFPGQVLNPPVGVLQRADIAITSDAVATAGANASAIVARALPGDVHIVSGTAGTRGDGSRGIVAQSEFGEVLVTSDFVATQGDGALGIVAASGPFGTQAVVTSVTVHTSGDSATGIAAYGRGVVVRSGTVTTEGDDGTGIFARAIPHFLPSDYSRDSSVTSGSVTTSGADSPGIVAESVGGMTEVTSTGTVATTGAGSDGIVGDSDVGSVIVDAAAVNVSGAGSEAIVVTSATTSTVTIRGLVQSGQSFAVQADGGPATLNTVAGGTLRGRFDLTDGADTLNNAGTLDVIGTSQFGGGADVLNNNAGGTLRSVNGAGVIAGAETVNNRSLIEMRDGAANDTLNLSGAFSGQAGSSLGIDVNFDAGTADVLILGAATGTTAINLQGTGSVFSLGNDGILVVDASAGTQSGAFTLGSGGGGNAYVGVGLRFDPAAFNFLLVGGPNQPIFETSQIGGMLSALWYETADAVGAQLDTSRDGGGANEAEQLRGTGGAGIWVQAMASDTDNEAVQSFTGGGGTQVFDVEYEQDYEGLQGGVDLASGGLTFGITGGFGKSDSVFEVTGNRLEVDVTNIGAYAEFRSGGLWVNGLVKMDWMDVTTEPGPGLAAEFDAKSLGALLSLGYRADLGGLFVEPSAGIAWVNTDIDSYQSGGATIDFDDSESMRAHAGIRVGSVFEIGENATLAPYVGVRAFEELLDDNTNRFTLGQTLSLGDDSTGTHGRAEAGFSLHAAGVEAFLRGELDFGGDTEGKGVRGGIRLRF